ncbi:MAG: hypothetical protein H6746_01700 [Deltaproteobacteria bacterium]|nr:hypothetical protein [Deltaproteobacteria bacterium]
MATMTMRAESFEGTARTGAMIGSARAPRLRVDARSRRVTLREQSGAGANPASAREQASTQVKELDMESVREQLSLSGDDEEWEDEEAPDTGDDDDDDEWEDDDDDDDEWEDDDDDDDDWEDDDDDDDEED